MTEKLQFIRGVPIIRCRRKAIDLTIRLISEAENLCDKIQPRVKFRRLEKKEKERERGKKIAIAVIPRNARRIKYRRVSLRAECRQRRKLAIVHESRQSISQREC